MIDLLGKVLEKVCGEAGVYTPNAISVLSLALCMVIDVIFPVDGRRCHLICWAGALVSNLLAALGWRGFVWPSRVLIRRDGRAGSSECCLPNGGKKFLIPRVFWCRASERCAVWNSQQVVLAHPFFTCLLDTMVCMLAKQGWTGGECVAWVRDRWNASGRCCTQNFVMERNRDGGPFVDLSDLCSCCPLFGVILKREHW